MRAFIVKMDVQNEMIPTVLAELNEVLEFEFGEEFISCELWSSPSAQATPTAPLTQSLPPE